MALFLDSDCGCGGDNINNLARFGVQGVAKGVGVSIDYWPSGFPGYLPFAVGMLGVF